MAAKATRSEAYSLVMLGLTLPMSVAWLTIAGSGVRDEATCLVNLRHIGAATRMYCEDNDGRFPAAYTNNSDMGGLVPFPFLLEPYLKAGANKNFVFAAINDANGGQPDDLAKSWANSGGAAWHCPADRLGTSMSYGLNPTIAGAYDMGGIGRAHIRSPYWMPSLRTSDVDEPGRVFWAGDTNKLWQEDRQRYTDVFTDWIRAKDAPVTGMELPERVRWYREFLRNDYTDARGDCLSPGDYSCKGPAYRHRWRGPRSGAAGVVFIDGHAQIRPFGSIGVENVFPHLPSSTAGARK